MSFACQMPEPCKDIATRQTPGPPKSLSYADQRSDKIFHPARVSVLPRAVLLYLCVLIVVPVSIRSSTVSV